MTNGAAGPEASTGLNVGVVPVTMIATSRSVAQSAEVGSKENGVGSTAAVKADNG